MEASIVEGAQPSWQPELLSMRRDTLIGLSHAMVISVLATPLSQGRAAFSESERIPRLWNINPLQTQSLLSFHIFQQYQQYQFSFTSFLILHIFYRITNKLPVVQKLYKQITNLWELVGLKFLHGYQMGCWNSMTGRPALHKSMTDKLRRNTWYWTSWCY